MDPTEFFSSEVVEMIFSHLRGRELASATLVSPAWNNHIGSSLVCMNKLTLKIFCEDHHGPALAKAATRYTRSRKYQHVRIYRGEKHCWNCVLGIMESGRNWRTVKISHLVFPSMASFIELYETFESTVQNFEVIETKLKTGNTTVDIKSVQDMSKIFKFSQLRKYSFKESDDMIAIDQIKCTTLRSLHFYNLFMIPNALSIREMLKNQRDLKNLSFRFNDFHEIFQLENFPFRLEELTIATYPRGKEDVESIVHFLKGQSKIKKLNLVGVMDQEIFTSAFGLKMLKEVKIDYQDLWITVDNLPTNESVETLDMSSMYICPDPGNFIPRTHKHGRLEAFLRFLPNLKEIKIQQVDEEFCSFAQMTLKSLQRIVTKDSTPLVIQRKFPKIDFVTMYLFKMPVILKSQ